MHHYLSLRVRQFCFVLIPYPGCNGFPHWCMICDSFCWLSSHDLMVLFNKENRVLVDYSGFPTVMAVSLPQFCIISEQSLLWEPVGFIEKKPVQNLTKVQNHSIFAGSRSFNLFHQCMLGVHQQFTSHSSKLFLLVSNCLLHHWVWACISSLPACNHLSP